MSGRRPHCRNHAAGLFQAASAAGFGPAGLERRCCIARAAFSGGFDVAAAQGVAKADIHGCGVLDLVCGDGGVGKPFPQIIRKRIKQQVRMIVNCGMANPVPDLPALCWTPYEPVPRVLGLNAGSAGSGMWGG